MGGCKCAYRTCSKTSDKKTHFFHFPAKDPVRCHQWMINSNRLDFKSYQTSQLKNKVVCEDHFPEHMFMNYKHDRLIHNAVPVKDETDDKSNMDDTDDETDIPESTKTQDIPTKDIDINTLDTCTNNSGKELSTMTVNVSPITGLSFFNPVEKKQNGAPYIELLTRLHTNQTPVSKLPATKTTPSVIQTKNSKSPQSSAKTSNQTETTPKNTTSKRFIRKTRVPFKEEHETVFNQENVNFVEPTVPIITPSEIIKKRPIYMTNESNKSNSLFTPVNISVPNNSPILRKIPPNANVLKNSKGVIVQNCNNLSLPITPATIYNQNPPKVTILENNLIAKGNDMPNNIIIFPMDSELQIPTQVTNSSQTYETDDLYKHMKDENARIMNEMKSIQMQFEEYRKENKKSLTSRKVIKKTKFPPLSKAVLYARIVPFLSPKLAKQVHKEMFPSLRSMHRE